MRAPTFTRKTAPECRLGVRVSADLDVVVEHACDPKEEGYGTNERRYARFVPSIHYLTAHVAPVGPNAIAAAAARGVPNVLEESIRMCADVNSRTTSYQNAVMMAAAPWKRPAQTLRANTVNDLHAQFERKRGLRLLVFH
jgi:hypothetical protein